jgi:hypothetical protein
MEARCDNYPACSLEFAVSKMHPEVAVHEGGQAVVRNFESAVGVRCITAIKIKNIRLGGWGGCCHWSLLLFLYLHTVM